MVDQLQQLRIFPEEMSTSITAWLDGVFLVITINSFLHPFQQKTGLVRRQELVPVRPPNHFNDIPASPLENSFKFLDNFAVATNRSIEALQVAVNDPNQVI